MRSLIEYFKEFITSTSGFCLQLDKDSFKSLFKQNSLFLKKSKSSSTTNLTDFFSDLSCEESPVVSPAASGRAKRPSYVGISTSLNG